MKAEYPWFVLLQMCMLPVIPPKFSRAVKLTIPTAAMLVPLFNSNLFSLYGQEEILSPGRFLLKMHCKPAL